MAFDELSINHRGVAGGQSLRHTKALLNGTHIAFNVIVDLEAIGFKMFNPSLAAAAIGVAVHVECQRIRRICGACKEKCCNKR